MIRDTKQKTAREAEKKRENDDSGNATAAKENAKSIFHNNIVIYDEYM